MKKVIAVAVIIIILISVLILNFYLKGSEEKREERVEGEEKRSIPYVDDTFGFNVNVQPGDKPTNEPSIAVNPLDPMNIVAAGNDYNNIRQDAWVGYYWTKDGGKTWSQGLIPGYLGDTSISPLQGYAGTGDPVVAFDGEGNCYIAGIAFQREPVTLAKKDSAIFVAKSTDGGETFSSISIVVQSYTKGTFHDKEWMTVDQRNGNIYVSWTVFHAYSASQILFSKSTDGGETWSVPKVISEVFEAELQVQGSYIVVDNDGEIHIIWIDFGNNQMRYVKSTDDGETFSTPKDIADVVPIPYQLNNGTYRTPTIPALAVDNSNSPYNGSLYATWNDYRNGDADILMVYSRDKGETWSEPVRVNNDELSNGKDQFFPAIAVSPQGYVNIIFYDRRDDPDNTLIHTYYAFSNDGGENFTINFNITEVQFNGDHGGGSFIGSMTGGDAFIGDYIGLASGNETVHAIWCDTRNGSPDDRNSDLYTAIIRVVERG